MATQGVGSGKQQDRAPENKDSAPLPWADLEAYRADYRRRNPIPDPRQVIPDLAARPQWLMWRYEPPEKPTSKPRKMPYYASGKKRTGGQGSAPDRSALVTYEVAATAAAKRGFDGVGFAFLPGDGLVGIDLDGMIDSDSGEIAPRCAEIIQACASYTEWSPSGKGVHIICTADGISQDDVTLKSNKIGVEVFSGRQYFTFTGRPWPGSTPALHPLAAGVLRRLHATIRQARGPGLPGAEPPSSSPPPPPHAGEPRGSLVEKAVLAEEALQFLDPDDYPLWIDMGMACKEGLGSAGYIVWDTWSARSPKYAGAADTASRWKSFDPKKITLGSLFGLAEAAGWVSPWAKAREKKARPRKPPLPPSSPPVETAGSSSQVEKPEVPAPAPAGKDSYPSKAPAGGGGADAGGGGAPPGPPPDDDWPQELIRKKGDLSPCLANAELILSHMREWQGAIGYDEFAERTVFRTPLPFDRDGSKSGEWSDYLDTMATIWLQRAWHVEFSTTTVGKAVEAVARSNRFHPVHDALLALPPWDGIRRNSEWLSDYLSVERTEYTALVGAFFLRGMIQRVMEPGCKFDYCLVLEGEQGRGKSTVARILAWHWFCDTDLDLSNKDALLALPGHWVYEIAELGSLMKAEERKQKSFLSRQEDEYRPPYGQRLIKVPRQVVFIGTTNEEEYLKDATGGRRFWPVMCGNEFNLDGLREALPQMFAEALADYRAGERSWPTPEEQLRLFSPEQAKRGMQEPFEEILRTWVDSRTAPFTMAEAATDGLGLTADKLTPAVVTRIGIALKKLGCGRKENRLAADPGERRLYLNAAMKRLDMRGTACAKGGAGNGYF